MADPALSPSLGPTGTSARKRKTAANTSNHQACLACKGRKIRCNGDRPCCSYCKTRDINCVIPPPYKRPRCSQEHVDALEAKVRALEDEIQLFRAGRKANDVPAIPVRNMMTDRDAIFDTPQPTGLDGQEITADLHRPVVKNTGLETYLPVVDVTESDDEDGLDGTPATDGMVQYNSNSPEGQQGVDSFALSASFSFAANIRATACLKGRFHIKHSQQPMLPERGKKDLEEAQQLYLEGDEAALALSVNLTSLQFLPHRHVATLLLDRFFHIVYPATPYVLEGETRRRFESLWTSDKQPNPLWLAQMNMIFALSCQFSESRPDQDPLVGDAKAVGENFYRQARRFIVANSSRRTSVAMLQLMLLEINYYQGTGQANECWLTVGTVIRIAQALGLHRRLPQSSIIPVMTQELYKRLWWGYYFLDRVSSMVYGLPMGIPPIRLTENDDTLPSPGGNEDSASRSSPHALFHHTIRLYILMDEIWFELRHLKTSGPKEIESLTILSAIARFDKRLIRWHRTLPLDLIFSIDDDDNIEQTPKWAQSQKIMLKLRFLAMRIYLHRQTLLFLLQPGKKDIWPPSTPAQWPPIFSDVGFDASKGVDDDLSSEETEHSQAEHDLAQISAAKCVSSAQTQIRFIEIYRRRQLTGSWWWNLHFIFNSLCVLCASMGLPEPTFSNIFPDIQTAKMAIRRGFSVLRAMSSQWGNQVAQSDRFLLSLLKTMLRTRGQDLHDMFTDETRQEPPQCGNIEPDLSDDNAFLDFATWQSAINVDHSQISPGQLFMADPALCPPAYMLP